MVYISKARIDYLVKIFKLLAWVAFKEWDYRPISIKILEIIFMNRALSSHIRTV